LKGTLVKTEVRFDCRKGNICHNQSGAVDEKHQASADGTGENKAHQTVKAAPRTYTMTSLAQAKAAGTEAMVAGLASGSQLLF
jgi:hypothetical protein